MYAIIETGGKQYRVKKGDVIDVELLSQEESAPVEFTQVLFVGGANEPKVGAPLVSGCVVRGELLGETQGPKVVAFKYKRRKNYRRKVGHRQRYSQVKITEIAG